ncbi:hypothetical protein BJ322DRAFT_284954 [Thelephora terrestris]|uniref:F-box domain-containing protein n=1 Tax=Thelephora terrestris TaxID=56493 RepID=A0A9P6H707_9AGAM|nr:hypothetical protein BJ322DRAFT_284954 [Thelephora terrestris]
MSLSRETYPGHDYSLSQLLHAMKRKLQHTAFDGRVVTTVNRIEANTLEQDALEVLCLVRSLKNSLAPINKIPPEVLSLLPDYCGKGDDDRDLIKLTHVCRGWRELFTTRSSLWTQLDFRNVEKTRAYIQRSKYSPLELSLKNCDGASYTDEATSLMVPHIHRLKSLTVFAKILPEVFEHCFCAAPLLEELDICVAGSRDPVLDSALFNGDLSTLRVLSLYGVTTHLPWRTLANLRALTLGSWGPKHGVTQLLDIFESSPLLQTVSLEDSVPELSDAPPERIVSLPHLKSLTLTADPPHSILLNHLCVPVGASLTSWSIFSGEESPLLDYLPDRSPNFKNLSCITSVNLSFRSTQKFVRLCGPSGNLHLLAHWEGGAEFSSYVVDHRVLFSLSPPILSKTERLSISKYKHSGPAKVEDCLVFRALSSTKSLRALVLVKCHTLPFILALNPEENPSKLMLCPNLKELHFYNQSSKDLQIGHLVRMAKSRALRGAKLSSISIVGLRGFVPGRGVSKLRAHIVHLECRSDDASPAWDSVPGESSYD